MSYLPTSKKTPSSADGVLRRVAAWLLVLIALAGPAAAQGGAPDLKTNINSLAAFDFAARMNAARAIRRVPAADAVPALTDAVAKSSDEFVRYRAFILLTAFNDRGTADLAKSLLRDRNDRLREAAYKWLEAHPDPGLTVSLINALQTEQAEFVRPALVGALAALHEDAQVQRALLPEVTRGLDFFRGAAIDALGRRRAAYAVDAIAGVAKLEGPLQDDAAIALGRIGGARALATLTELAAGRLPADMTLTVRAAQCVAGQKCDETIKALVDAVSAQGASAAIVRAGVSGLTAIAEGGNQAATMALLDLGRRAGAVHDQAAVGLATVAVRDPEFTIAWLDRALQPTRDAAIGLLKDGFDDLEEDFGEEQFFATARAAYWKAPDGSDTRSLTATLIQRLEF